MTALVLFASSDTHAAEPICPGGSNPDPNVIFCSDFEWSTATNYKAPVADWLAHSWSETNSDAYGASGVYCNSSTYPGAASHGQCGLVIDVLENDQGSPWPTKRFADYGGGAGVGAPLYARWYMKVSSDFVYHPNSSKHFYFFRCGPGGADPCTSRVPVFVTSDNGSTHRYEPFFKLYDSECPNVTLGNYFQNQGTPMWLASPENKNVWHAIEIMVKSSSPGGTDGELKMWINGTLKLHHTNVRNRCAGDTRHFNKLWLNSYLGGSGTFTHPRQEIYYDQLVVSRAPIGLLGSPRPLPPANLAVR